MSQLVTVEKKGMEKMDGIPRQCTGEKKQTNKTHQIQHTIVNGLLNFNNPWINLLHTVWITNW